MPAKNEDLHGNAPEKADVALVMIDVINDLEFPEGDMIVDAALQMAERLAAPDSERISLEDVLAQAKSLRTH